MTNQWLQAAALVLAVAVGQAHGLTLQIDLVPEFDTYGPHVETVQVIQTPGGPQTTFGIYDTGASVITFSAFDQLIFDFLGSPMEVKCAGCASANAIGGVLTGDVGAPATIWADGLNAITFGSSEGFPTLSVDISNAASVGGIQSFIGTTSGSPILPTITGTPIHNSGKAALINMQGFELDLEALFPELPEFSGIKLFLPNVAFVDPSTTLPAGSGTVSDPVRVPMEFFGGDNSADPGNQVTSVSNPVHTHTGLAHGALSVSDQTFLFDTGAQLSIISTAIADALGLDLVSPFGSITVQGAAGTTQVEGYVIDSLSLALDNNGDGLSDGTLTFTNVPVFVLDIVDGLDGILGMNLFNTATEMLYNPHDPAGASLTLAFDTNPDRVDQLDALEGLSPDADLLLEALALLFPSYGNMVTTGGLPSFQFDPSSSQEPGGPGGAGAIPEPSTLAAMLLALAFGAMLRRRR